MELLKGAEGLQDPHRTVGLIDGWEQVKYSLSNDVTNPNLETRPNNHWFPSFLVRFHSSQQTSKGENLETSHAREHFFFFFFQRQLFLHSGLTKLFLALILHRKDKLDHMLVPIKTLAVGIQELHHKSWKSLIWRGNSCIKGHFYNIQYLAAYRTFESLRIFLCKMDFQTVFVVKKVIKVIKSKPEGTDILYVSPAWLLNENRSINSNYLHSFVSN